MHFSVRLVDGISLILLFSVFSCRKVHVRVPARYVEKTRLRKFTVRKWQDAMSPSAEGTIKMRTSTTAVEDNKKRNAEKTPSKEWKTEVVCNLSKMMTTTNNLDETKAIMIDHQGENTTTTIIGLLLLLTTIMTGSTRIDYGRKTRLLF